MEALSELLQDCPVGRVGVGDRSDVARRAHVHFCRSGEHKGILFKMVLLTWFKLLFPLVQIGPGCAVVAKRTRGSDMPRRVLTFKS
jgi:hypothetical protein